MDFFRLFLFANGTKQWRYVGLFGHVLHLSHEVMIEGECIMSSKQTRLLRGTPIDLRALIILFDVLLLILYKHHVVLATSFARDHALEPLIHILAPLFKRWDV